MTKPIRIKWFLAATVSGFLAVGCTNRAIGHSNSPYIPLAVFFILLSGALCLVAGGPYD